MPVHSVRGYLSSCQVPNHIPSTIRELDEALVAIAAFLDNLMGEEKKLMTVEGSNAGYVRLMDAMCRCFDWGRLASTPPSRDDVVAFLTVCDLLRPYLMRTEWPRSSDFPSVTRGWPSRDALALQYSALLRRVRQTPFRNPALCKETDKKVFVKGRSAKSPRAK